MCQVFSWLARRNKTVQWRLITLCFSASAPALPADLAAIEAKAPRKKKTSPSIPCGRRLRISPSSVGEHRANVGFRDDRAVDLGVAVKPPHRPPPADGAQVILDGIARHYRLAELAFVDGQKVNRARLLGALDGEDADHPGGLGHGFDHHHTRIYRALGKMPLERRLVDGDILDADTAVVAADIDHPIN